MASDRLLAAAAKAEKKKEEEQIKNEYLYFVQQQSNNNNRLAEAAFKAASVDINKAGGAAALREQLRNAQGLNTVGGVAALRDAARKTLGYDSSTIDGHKMNYDFESAAKKFGVEKSINAVNDVVDKEVAKYKVPFQAAKEAYEKYLPESKVPKFKSYTDFDDLIAEYDRRIEETKKYHITGNKFLDNIFKGFGVSNTATDLSQRQVVDYLENTAIFNRFEDEMQQMQRERAAFIQQRSSMQQQMTIDKIRQNNDENLFEELYEIKTVQTSNKLTNMRQNSQGLYGTADINQYSNREKEIRQQLAAKGYTDEDLRVYDAYKDAVENKEITDYIDKVVEEHPVVGGALLTAGNVMLSPMRGIAALTDAGNSAGFNPGKAIGNINRDVQAAVGKQIDERVGGKKGKALKFAYNVAVSSAESAFGRVTTGGASVYLMGLNAAASTYDEALNRGLDKGNAAATAITAGIFEALFEHVAWDKISMLSSDGLKKVPAMIKDFLVAAGTEGSEEVLTDLSNELWDYLTNGGLSEYETARASGMSAAEYAKQFGLDLLESFAAGAASGGLSYAAMSGKNYTTNKAITAARNVATGNLINTRGNADAIIQQAEAIENADEAIAESAEKVKKKLSKTPKTKIGAAVHNVSLNVSTGQLYDNVSKAVVKDAVANKVADIKEIPKAKKADFVEAVVDLYGGKQLDGPHENLVTTKYKNDAGEEVTVIDELEKGEAKWVQNLSDKLSVQRAAAVRGAEGAAEAQSDIKLRKRNVIESVNKDGGRSLVEGFDADYDNGTNAKIGAIAAKTENGIEVFVDDDGGEAGAQVTAEYSVDNAENKIAVTDEDVKALYQYAEDQIHNRIADDNLETFGTAFQLNTGVEMSIPAANVEIGIYDPAINKNVNAYCQWFYDAYKAGKSGISFSKYMAIYKDADYEGEISGEQLAQAFRQGARDHEFKPGVTRIGVKKMSDSDKKIAAALHEEFKAHGLSLVIVDSLKSDDLNGYYLGNGNTIVVALDADQGLFSTAAYHELFHVLEQRSPEAAKELTDTVIDLLNTKMGDERYNEIYQQRLKDYGDNEKLVKSEIVAQYIGTLASADIDTVAKEMQKQPGLWQKIVDTFKDIIDSIKSKLLELSIKDETVRAALDTEIADAEKVLKMFSEALDKAVENNNEGIRSGEIRYSYKGINAADADVMQLEAAKELEKKGIDSEYIRQHTGWFRGYDNKWRFEIDDSDSRMIDNVKLDENYFYDDLYYTAKLSDIFDHKYLYKAYPQLKDITVVIQETKAGVEGSYHSFGKSIVLNSHLFEKTSNKYQDEIDAIEQTEEYKAYNKYFEMDTDNVDPVKWLEEEKAAEKKFYESEVGKRYYQLMWGKGSHVTKQGWSDKAKTVLIHEIQHAVQDIEKFAKGSNERYWKNKISAGYDTRDTNTKNEEKKLLEKIDQYKNNNPEMYNDVVELIKTRPNVPRAEINWETFEKIEDDPVEWQKYDARRDELDKFYNSDDVFDLIRLFSMLDRMKNRNTRDAGRLYYETAGEIEARDVEKRLEYNLEQRRNIRPDIDYEDVVFADEARYSKKMNASDDYYSQVTEKRNELQEKKKQLKELQNSEEYQNLLYKSSTTDDIDSFIKEYGQYLQKSGMQKLNADIAKLEEEVNELQKKFKEQSENKALREEQEAIKKSGKTEAEYFNHQAVKEFGYTPYYYDAGYMMPNGKLLNLSGEKGQHFGSRGEDHRIVGVLFADTEGTQALIRFQKYGNIRIMDETPGVDIHFETEPTAEQYRALKKYVQECYKRKYFNVDITDDKGYNVGSLSYENNFSADRVINDIKNYFDTGEIREQSIVDRFRYSKKLDSETQNTISDLQAQNESLREMNEALKSFVGDLQSMIATERKERAAERKERAANQKFIPTRTAIEEVAKKYNNRSSVYTNSEFADRIQAIYYNALKQNPDSLTSEWTIDADMLTANLYDLLDEVIDSSYTKEVNNEEEYKEIKSEFFRKRFAVSQEVYDFLLEEYSGQKGLNAALRGKFTLRVQGTEPGLASMDSSFSEMAEAYPHLLDQETDVYHQVQEVLAAFEASKPIIHDMKDVLGYGTKGAAVEYEKFVMQNVYDIFEELAAAIPAAPRIAKLQADLGLARKTAREEQKKYNDLLKATGGEKGYNELKDYYKQKIKDTVEYQQSKFEREQKIKNIKRAVRRINAKFESNSKNKRIIDDMKPIIKPFIDAFLGEKRADDSNSFFSEVEMNRLKGFYNELQIGVLKKNRDKDDPNNAVTSGPYDRFYTDAVLEDINELQKTVVGKSIRSLTVEELRKVNEIVDNFSKMITESEEIFVNGKKVKIVDSARRFAKEASQFKGKKIEGPIMKAVYRQFTPIYFFKELLGEEMGKYYDDMRNAQDDWVKKIDTAITRFDDIKNRYHYDKWKDDEIEHTFSTGFKHTFTTETILQIYATAKRESTVREDTQHLFKGGIVFSEDFLAEKKKREKANKKKSKKDNSEEIDNYDETTWLDNISRGEVKEILAGLAVPMSLDDYQSLIGSLTAEQKAYADSIVEFMSTEVGAWGNKATSELYGIDIFNEKYYFPFKVDDSYRNSGSVMSGDPSILARGFTKRLTHKANPPLMLSSFTEVAANHVQDMAQYSAFAIPVSNMQSLYYASIPRYEEDEDGLMDPIGIPVKGILKAVFGEGAEKYMHKFLQDVNGGIKPDSAERAYNKMFSMFKRSAVLGNLQVVVQQPTAIMRAMAILPPQDFLGKASGKDFKEMMKYSEVAKLKSWGGFDIGSSGSATSWIINEKETIDKIADALGKGAEFADAVTWTNIWNACKRNVRKNTDLEVGSDEYFEAVKNLFREVCDYTQVYDSTLTRNEWMRSKSATIKTLTAFGAEPSVSFNLLFASTNNRNINHKRAIVAYVFNVLVNELFKSITQTIRKKDNDRNFFEQYLSNFLGNLVGTKKMAFLDGAWNPASLIFMVKDILSVIEGWSIERPDMSVISDIVNAVNKFVKKGIKNAGLDDYINLVGAISSATPIPLNAILRDGFGIANLIFSKNDNKFTADALKYSLRAEIWDGTKQSDVYKAYHSVVNNETETIRRMSKYTEAEVRAYMQKGYDREEAEKHAAADAEKRYHNKIVEGIIAIDKDVSKAADALNDGNLTQYENYVELLKKKGFTQNDVITAVNKLYNAMQPEDLTEVKETQDKLLYTNDQLKKAYSEGNVNNFKHVAEYLLQNGKTQTAINSTVSDMIWDKFDEGKSSLSDVRKEFKTYTDLDDEKIDDRLKTKIMNMYKDGKITASKAADYLVQYANEESEYARNALDFYEWQAKDNNAEKYPDVDKNNYNSYINNDYKSLGVDFSSYLDIREKYNSFHGETKQADIAAYINTLPYSRSVKQQLFLKMGKYSPSALNKFSFK